jgi:hypothetical protein
MGKLNELKVMSEPPVPEQERVDYYNVWAKNEMIQRNSKPPIQSACCNAPVFYSTFHDDNICVECKRICNLAK